MTLLLGLNYFKNIFGYFKHSRFTGTPDAQSLKNGKSSQSERKRELAFEFFLKGHWLRGGAIEVLLVDWSMDVLSCIKRIIEMLHLIVLGIAISKIK